MHKRIPIILSIFLLIVAAWLQTTHIDTIKQLILRLNNIAYDMQLRATLFTHHMKPKSPVVIVDIDDHSLKNEGRWPWPREKLATLVKRLQEEGVVVIAMDIMFSEKENNVAETILQELETRKLSNPTLDSL